MLQMFNWKYTLKKSVSSPPPHSTDFSSFLQNLPQSSLVLNTVLWGVLAWLMRQAMVKQRAETILSSTQPSSVPGCQVKCAKDSSKPQLRWLMISHQLITTNSTNSTGYRCNNWYKQLPSLVIKRRRKSLKNGFQDAWIWWICKMHHLCQLVKDTSVSVNKRFLSHSSTEKLGLFCDCVLTVIVVLGHKHILHHSQALGNNSDSS